LVIIAVLNVVVVTLGVWLAFDDKMFSHIAFYLPALIYSLELYSFLDSSYNIARIMILLKASNLNSKSIFDEKTHKVFYSAEMKLESPIKESLVNVSVPKIYASETLSRTSLAPPKFHSLLRAESPESSLSLSRLQSLGYKFDTASIGSFADQKAIRANSKFKRTYQ
jgi:hypothetical protein